MPTTEYQIAGFYTASYAAAAHTAITHIPGSYHFIMFDAADVFRKELASFLA